MTNETILSIICLLIFLVIILAIFIFYIKTLIYDFNITSRNERDMWIKKVEVANERIDELHTIHSKDLKIILTDNNQLILSLQNSFDKMQEVYAKLSAVLNDVNNTIHRRIGL